MSDEEVLSIAAKLLRDLQARVPADAAAMLLRTPPEHLESVLASLPKDFAARVAAHLPEERRPASFRAEAEEVDTGRIEDLMEPPRGLLPAETTVQEAVEFLRRAPDAADITYLYVTDAQQRLRGMVILRDLVLARADQELSEVMLREPFRFNAGMELSDAVRAAVKRHYPVYPVCDAQGRMVGLVRGWRLFERHAVEIIAQTGRMVGLTKEERLDTSLWTAFRKRHPWLQLNLLTAFLAAFVVGSFADTITRIVALAAFLPVLAGQSGNNGCQALAITLRGITMGEFDQYPLRRLLLKEVLLGGLNGLLTGIVAGLAMAWSVGFSDPLALRLALVILLAMTGACMTSGLFGVMVPLVLRRAGADPATASSIFLTTGTDIAGMGLMLLLATMIVL